MKILVTGGAGFLGSHLCKRLDDEGHAVIAFDNFFTAKRENIEELSWSRRFELVRGDVVDPFHFEVDQIYHLACPASPVHYQRNPARTIETAVVGTRNALRLARDVGARILIASTSEVYGDPLEHPQNESYWGNCNSFGPRACYDEGKRCGEALAHAWSSQYGVETRIARIFNTYGPRMAVDDGRVVSNFVCQALRGEAVTIYGDGTQTRSFCYVDDTIEGLVRLMSSDVNTPVNLGNPDEFTMFELAEVVFGAIEKPAEIVRRPLPKDDPRQRRPDIARALELLGWSPRVKLLEGIRRTVEYFRHGRRFAAQ